MSYVIAMATLASEALDGVPPSVRNRVDRELVIVAEYPTLLSQRSDLSDQIGCQSFRFQVERLADRWTFTVLFRYGQDEQTLTVLAVARSARDRADADEDEGPAV